MEQAIHMEAGTEAIGQSAGKFGTVYYVDCLDAQNGLPSLPAMGIDLALTDPPYNVGLDIEKTQGSKGPDGRDKIKYSDKRKAEDYRKWCMRWFLELDRICERILITPGTKYIWMWGQIETPKGILTHYKKNCASPGQLFRVNRQDFMLAYGRWKFRFEFDSDVFDIPLRSGFQKKKCDFFDHPCPKSYEWWHAVLARLKPRSVIDPFMGSGTTAQACEELGIEYIGYEIMPEYRSDIERRMRQGERDHGKTFLDRYIPTEAV